MEKMELYISVSLSSQNSEWMNELFTINYSAKERENCPMTAHLPDQLADQGTQSNAIL